jgi:hypothetical protein
MDAMIPLVIIFLAVVGFAAVAASFGYDSRDHDPRDAIGGHR